MIDLLSPVGDFDCLKAAVQNGANSVYFGANLFSARAFASNFDLDELKNAIQYARIRGVKTNLTLNTLIKNDEFEDAFNLAKKAYEFGIDAIIVQDLGLAKMLIKSFPDLAIHASTQMSVHNLQGVLELLELGFKRVVLSRELSIGEIEYICRNSNVEIECFIHGALCISYSGQCLFSSMIGGRSGNRGKCAQPCRLPYKLLENNSVIDSGYLLSTRDICGLDFIPDMINAGVTCLKIEGRMKSPSYVGYVTRIYRKLIDSYSNRISNKEEDNLKILFNREFTNGYLFKDKVMNIESSNHRGLDIGKVIDVNKKKIKIKLDKELYQEDGIRFKNSNKGMIANFIYNEKGLLIKKGNVGDIIYLDNKINLKDKDILVKTSSSYLDKEIITSSIKKILINIDIKLIDEFLDITFSDNMNNIVNDKVKVEPPVKRGTTNEEIKEKITKLGNTPFVCNNINIDIDRDIFVNMKDINNIRRLLCDKLITTRSNTKRDIIINKYSLDYNKEDDYNTEISILARNKEQVQAGIDMNIDRIYVDSGLYDIYKDNDKVYLRLERVNNNYNYDSKNILATEMGAIYKYRDSNLISDYYLNIVNNYSIKFLLDNGVKRVTLSPEVNYNYLDDYILDKVELIIYGTIENMITKSCPIKELKICPCKKEDIYYLEDINKNRYRVLHNNCLTHIMHYKKINYIDNISYYKNLGIRSYRLELLDESYDEVIRLIDEIRKK